MKRKIAESLFAFLKKRGYEVVPKGQSIENNMAYSHPVIPFSDYSPWLNDQEFQETFRKVGKNTLITEPQRMYELWQLAKEVSHLEGDMLEVGSWRGGSGALIAIASKAKENNTKVYLCDTFEGVVKAGELDNVYENQEHADTSDAIVHELIEKLELKESVKVLKGIFPDDTAHHLENEKFKFCHIDVDVYESAKATTEWVWDRMPVGGVIVYDDFGFKSMQGVTIYVESQRMKDDRLVIHNLNGHGIIIKTK